MFCDETVRTRSDIDSVKTRRNANEEYEQLWNDFLAIKKQKLREAPLLLCTWCAENVPDTVDNCQQCAVYYLKQHLIETEEQ